MGSSVWLLTAWATLGQAGLPVAQPQPGYSPYHVQGRPAYARPAVQAHVPHYQQDSLRQRLKRLFRPACDCKSGPVVGHTVRRVQTAPPPLAAAPEPAKLLPPVPKVAKKYEMKVGAAEDYSWITGQLAYVHAAGGLWVLRYATIDQQDKFGGSVILAPGLEMHNFREGDLVNVHGQVLREDRAYKQLGGALYRASHISMIDRADPPQE